MIQSSTTPDPGYQAKVTTSQLDTTNEDQEVSLMASYIVLFFNPSGKEQVWNNYIEGK